MYLKIFLSSFRAEITHHIKRGNLIPKTDLPLQYGVNKANQTIITENISLNQVKARPQRFPKLCSDPISRYDLYRPCANWVIRRNKMLCKKNPVIQEKGTEFRRICLLETHKHNCRAKHSTWFDGHKKIKLSGEFSLVLELSVHFSKSDNYFSYSDGQLMTKLF